MLWILFYYSLLLIAIIYFENLNIKIQYAAKNPGVHFRRKHVIIVIMYCHSTTGNCPAPPRHNTPGVIQTPPVVTGCPATVTYTCPQPCTPTLGRPCSLTITCNNGLSWTAAGGAPLVNVDSLLVCQCKCSTIQFSI